MKIPPPIPRISEADRQAIEEFLCTGALYGSLTVPGTLLDGDTLEKVLPPEVQRPCEKCGVGIEGRWRLMNLVQSAEGSTVARYYCKNCGFDFEVWFRWRHEYSASALRAMVGDRAADTEHPTGHFSFHKCGQYPPLSVNLPADLAKALGDHEGLYRKAMVSRNQNFGIGALGYFRRIVEDTANDMLDLLLEALREHGADAEVIQRVDDAKKERVFEKKAKVAAEALPESLRPGGANPFQSLHDQYSKGLHGLSDEDCIEIIDRMREDVGIIFKTLKTHVDDRKAYGAAVQRLQHRKPPAR